MATETELKLTLPPGSVDAPQRKTPLESLNHDLTLTAAFRSLAHEGLQHWQANVHAALIDRSPEIIHQVRVSQRRLRSLLRLFASVLPDTFVTDWNQRLRNNAARLGNARDLEVIRKQIVAPVASQKSSDALEALCTQLERALETANAQAFTALEPAEQGRLMLDFSLALHDLPADSGQESLKAFARKQLEQAGRKVRRRYRDARSREPEKLHALRIAVKRWRYGVEFLAPLLPAKATERYLKVLSRVQKRLGDLHDVDMARQTLLDLADDDPVLNRAVGFVDGWHSRMYDKQAGRALKETDTLLRTPRPWTA